MHTFICDIYTYLLKLSDIGYGCCCNYVTVVYILMCVYYEMCLFKTVRPYLVAPPVNDNNTNCFEARIYIYMFEHEVVINS